MPTLRMIVNGQPVTLDVPAHRTLAEVLRYDLGLTGTKIGCGEAECGACTVHVNGQPILSCIYPALKAQGAEVVTIEGLSNVETTPDTRYPIPDTPYQTSGYQVSGIGNLHPLQAAFVIHGATQCGFCTPGFIMQAAWLLKQNPNPTDEDIRRALKDTYCRCTGYDAIVDAVKAAAEFMRTGKMPPPQLPPTPHKPLHAVGQPLPRPDAVEKVTGKARYTDDYTFPGMLYGATLRSPYAHARIKRIDTRKAKALPGVHAVLTHEDVPGRKVHGLIYKDWPVLCWDVVRYVGDAVAIVAAESPEIAAQALDLIEVEYEPLQPVTTPIQALQPDAPVLHPEHPTGNLLKHIKVRHGEVEQGFAEADVIVERTYHTPRTEHAFLEPECSIAVPAGYDEDHPKLTVYVGSQIPYADREQIAAALGLPEDQVRVRGTLIGGGFGGKEDIAGQIHAALLAQATGRPVKVLYSRKESLRVHPKRHPTQIRVRIGAKRDGTITAVEATLYGDTGAYASLGDKVMTRATTHATGPYITPHAKIDCFAMYTNNPPAGAFRGFGVTQSAFAVESTMDILAHELGMDPVELRRKNALRVGATTATGQVLRESVGLLQCLDLVERKVRELTGGEDPWKPRPVPGAPHKVRAWGIAAAFKNTGLGGGAPDKATAEVEAFDDGTVEVRISSAEMGQGLPGVLAAIAAEELGLPLSRVRVLLSDTDLTPDGGPTTASRQTFVSGNACRYASRQLREVLALAASERLDARPDEVMFENGTVRANGRAADFGQAVRWAKEEGRETRLQYEYWAPETRPLGEGGDMHVAFSFAAQAAEVEVDTETGEVKVLRVVSAHDVGRAINPLALLGQIEGGIVMGLGNALTEHFIVEEGLPWTRRLGQYKMPGIQHMPEMISFLVEDEVSAGPYGAKGVGELPSIPTSPAITNAIYNAVGVRILTLPVDQDALLRALKEGRKEITEGWGWSGWESG